MRSASRSQSLTLIALAASLTALLAGCGRAGAPASGVRASGVRVVAAENFWGSIAAQLGGAKASVRSVIVDPETDPHSYEPTARDARMLAGAQLAVVNGIGYDNWATKLLQASPLSGRVVLEVGDLLRLGEGDNAHQWYAPGGVHRVVDALAADYERLDPKDSAYFAARRNDLLTRGFARYDALLREIRARYAGVPVGYSESIFRPLGEALGLRLLTPYSFAKAVADGTDVTAADKQLVDAQARERRIAVWVFNSQNVTPDVQRINELVRAQQIPSVTITETLAPATDSFEQWQVTQLQALARALHEATGR